MFRTIFGKDNTIKDTEHREGELYGVVTTFGKTFELRYGYYEEKDRNNPLCVPAIIYPDFIKKPVFTDNGEPFVTMMQDACDFFEDASERTEDSSCAECKHFCRGEEWFGICLCPRKRERNNE